MKLLKMKQRPAAGDGDESIYRRLALTFRANAIWPLNAFFVAEFSVLGETYRFYVLVPAAGRA